MSTALPACHGDAPVADTSERLFLLLAVCRVAEGAVANAAMSRESAVAAVLCDAEGRFAALGGRQGFARSVGSLYAGLTALFLGTGFQGRVVSRRWTGEIYLFCRATNGLAISSDSSLLLVSDHLWPRVSNFHTGQQVTALKHLSGANQVYVAPDGFVFVARSRRQPRCRADASTGAAQLHRRWRACGPRWGVRKQPSRRRHRESLGAASVSHLHFPAQRRGALVRQIARGRSKNSYLPLDDCAGVCFLNAGRDVAVLARGDGCASVFSLDGQFQRTLGNGILRDPAGIACYADTVVVVADEAAVYMFAASGGLLRTIGKGTHMFTHVTVHNNRLFVSGFHSDVVHLDMHMYEECELYEFV
jgi:hypothetical protein